MEDLHSKSLLIKLVNTTHGRDKTFRLIQHFSSLIHQFLFSNSRDSKFLKLQK